MNSVWSRGIFFGSAALVFCLVLAPPSWAKVFTWTDEEGKVHFTEDPTTVPERYRPNLEERSLPEEPGRPATKASPSKKEPKERPESPPRVKTSKKGPDTEQIESEVKDVLKKLLTFWKDGKFDAFYEYGDRTSRAEVAKEDFRRRMANHSSIPASAWEMIRETQVEVSNATTASVTAKIGYRPKNGGETRFHTETHQFKLQNDLWRVDLRKFPAGSKGAAKPQKKPHHASGR
jgi:hypothetical protein